MGLKNKIQSPLENSPKIESVETIQEPVDLKTLPIHVRDDQNADNFKNVSEENDKKSNETSPQQTMATTAGKTASPVTETTKTFSERVGETMKRAADWVKRKVSMSSKDDVGADVLKTSESYVDYMKKYYDSTDDEMPFERPATPGNLNRHNLLLTEEEQSETIHEFWNPIQH